MSQGNDGDDDCGRSNALVFKTELREHLPDGLKTVVGSLKAYNRKSRALLRLVATSGVVVNNVDISGTLKKLYLPKENGFTIESVCKKVAELVEKNGWVFQYGEKKHNKKSKIADLRTEINGLNGFVQTKDAVIAELKREITRLRGKIDVLKNGDHDGKTRDFCEKTYKRDLDKVGRNIERVQDRHNVERCKIARDALHRTSKRLKNDMKMVVLSPEEHTQLKNSNILMKNLVSCAQYLKKQRGDDNSRIAQTCSEIVSCGAASTSMAQRVDLDVGFCRELRDVAKDSNSARLLFYTKYDSIYWDYTPSRSNRVADRRCTDR